MKGLQRPRSRFWVRLDLPVKHAGSLGCRGMKNNRTASFLKRENKNSSVPELASPLLLAHSRSGAAKGSDAPLPPGFVHFRPRPTLCSPASENKGIVIKRRGVQVVQHVAPLTDSAVARALVQVMVVSSSVCIRLTSSSNLSFSSV